MSNRSGDGGHLALFWISKVNLVALRMVLAVVWGSCLYTYMSTCTYVDIHPLRKEQECFLKKYKLLNFIKMFLHPFEMIIFYSTIRFIEIDFLKTSYILKYV